MEEGKVKDKRMVVADEYTAELAKPSISSFNLPALFVASQVPPILESALLVVLPVWRDQVVASPFPSLPQRVGLVTAVGDHQLRLLPRLPFAPRDADFVERGVRKHNFCRRGTFQPNAQQNTFPVSQYGPLYAFTILGFTDFRTPFFDGAKLPYRRASFNFSRTFSSNVPNNVRHGLRQTLSSFLRLGRRQQVEGKGYPSDRKC
jgi:hypothetical protein